MKIRIDKSFSKDILKINDKKLLQKIQNIILLLENARSIYDIPHIKKIKGNTKFFRIKIGDYRLGLEELSKKEVCLLRFLHRKEIYRSFP